ncbi:hypothetical protein PIIN_05611 [Serendipita indica DSM 11827]|uniref:Uncharacterized protein n=1 Tax=Serendipita indica (strain DSM 11827) TaxID=1109443 RepID=G4TK33_SERID|nr:hypothetical protein PIIN_05611 [Serendipita indica DSM 11827]
MASNSTSHQLSSQGGQTAITTHVSTSTKSSSEDAECQFHGQKPIPGPQTCLECAYSYIHDIYLWSPYGTKTGASLGLEEVTTHPIEVGTPEYIKQAYEVSRTLYALTYVYTCYHLRLTLCGDKNRFCLLDSLCYL